MTPKQKAEELVARIGFVTFNGNNEHYHTDEHRDDCKQCALIAVDEIISALRRYGTKDYSPETLGIELAFYQNVKQEIEKL